MKKKKRETHKKRVESSLKKRQNTFLVAQAQGELECGKNTRSRESCRQHIREPITLGHVIIRELLKRYAACKQKRALTVGT